MLRGPIDFVGAIMSQGHTPVLLGEVLGFLAPGAGGKFLDCTFGGGGHSKALLEACTDAQVIAIDRDPEAGIRAEVLSGAFPGRFRLVDLNFGNLGSLPDSEFDGILFDFGLSSFQLDEPSRGFSFRFDGPADMRLDPRSGVPAGTWLETATEEMIVHAVRDLGEESQWRRVVRALRTARGTGALQRTASLAAIIESAIPARQRRESRIHPATRAFQGIRIAVNDEISAVEHALPVAFSKLRSGGVLCAISFHSLEDRPVKHYFRRLCGQPESASDSTPNDLRTRVADALTRRPVTPSEEEIRSNPRSRSAKLRAIRKL